MSLSGNDRLGLLDPSGLKRNLEPGLVDANDDLLLQLQGLPFPDGGAIRTCDKV